MDERVEERTWAAACLAVTRRALWFPALVLTVHIVASRFFLAYEYFPPLDIPMHLVGGFAVAFLFHASIETLSLRRLISRPDRLITLLLLFALVCASAVFWEFAEYVSDHTIGTQAQQGLEDTLLDMLLGIVGGAIFIAFAVVRARGERESPLAR